MVCRNHVVNVCSPQNTSISQANLRNNTTEGMLWSGSEPPLVGTQSNFSVWWYFVPTAPREWVVYTITDQIEHVTSAPSLSACTPNRCLQIIIIIITACWVERVSPLHTYKDLQSLLSPFSWNVARRAPSELVPWNTPCSPLASLVPPSKTAVSVE